MYYYNKNNSLENTYMNVYYRINFLYFITRFSILYFIIIYERSNNIYTYVCMNVCTNEVIKKIYSTYLHYW